MKPIKALLMIFIIILNFNSCQTIQLRNEHRREIFAVLNKFSDFLDIAQTEIIFSGRRYYMRGGPPEIFLSLHLKPNHNNREILFAIRDELIALYPTLTPGGFSPNFAIIFSLGGSDDFYSLFYSHRYWGFKGWRERWSSDVNREPPIGNSVLSEGILMERYGTPLQEDRHD